MERIIHMHCLSVFWEALSAILTTISMVISFLSLLLLGVSVFFVKHELDEMKTATYASVFKTTREMLQDDEIRKSRKYIFTEFNIHNLDDVAKGHADNVCTTYDATGQFIRYGLLPKEFIIDNWGYSIEKSWNILSEYVTQIRNERNATEIWDDFQWLAGEAIQYRLTR